MTFYLLNLYIQSINSFLIYTVSVIIFMLYISLQATTRGWGG